MAAPRPVRIARAGSRPSASDGFRPNTGGMMRAVRLYFLFLLVLVVMFFAFVALAQASPSPGVRSNVDVWSALLVAFAALSFGGWAITLGRTPRGVAHHESEVVVRERLGHLRHFDRDDVSRARVAYRNPSSFLGPEPTEMVEMVSREGSRRTYLLAEGILDAPGRGPD